MRRIEDNDRITIFIDHLDESLTMTGGRLIAIDRVGG
jgi:hypothetical protein